MSEGDGRDKGVGLRDLRSKENEFSPYFFFPFFYSCYSCLIDCDTYFKTNINGDVEF